LICISISIQISLFGQSVNRESSGCEDQQQQLQLVSAAFIKMDYNGVGVDIHEDKEGEDYYDLVEYPHDGNNRPVSLETFSSRKMAFNDIDVHQDLMRQRQQYIMACMAGFRLLRGYIHETGKIDIKFDVDKMMSDYRKWNDEFEIFTSTADFPYAGIFKSYDMSGFYIVL
jgi:hypothetical protein